MERTLSRSDLNEFIDINCLERVPSVTPVEIVRTSGRKGPFLKEIPVLMVHIYVVRRS